MKDLLSKEHYCCKIHTLVMKSIAYPPPPLSIDDLPHMDAPHFYKKILIPPSMIFQKSQLSLSYTFSLAIFWFLSDPFANIVLDSISGPFLLFSEPFLKLFSFTFPDPFLGLPFYLNAL